MSNLLRRLQRARRGIIAEAWWRQGRPPVPCGRCGETDRIIRIKGHPLGPLDDQEKDYAYRCEFCLIEDLDGDDFGMFADVRETVLNYIKAYWFLTPNECRAIFKRGPSCYMRTLAPTLLTRDAFRGPDMPYDLRGVRGLVHYLIHYCQRCDLSTGEPEQGDTLG